tara:strand:- start:1653 stop:2171 length:519 start_codon:yes stop_codon:yes gene_type:complete
MGAGILPVSLYRGSVYILLGQERYNNLWGDFGGSHIKGEDNFTTAIREGSEELNGLLGNKNKLKKKVNENIIVTISNTNDKYKSYIFNLKYDKNLVEYFDNLNSFIEEYLKDKIDNDHNGLFEKKTIKWFNINYFNNKENFKIIRPHYKSIIETVYKRQNFVKSEIIDKTNN